MLAKCLYGVAKILDKMTTIAPSRSQVFRTPTATERALGLWVDRVGEKRDCETPERLRLLGLYGAVHVRGGEGVFETGAHSLHVAAGQTMLLFPNEPHRYGPTGGTWDTCWVVWGGERSAVFEHAGYLSRHTPVVDDTRRSVTRARERLLPLMSRPDRVACMARQNILQNLVLELAEQTAAGAARGADDVVGEAVAYIDAHYLEPLHPGDIAARLAISHTHLRRLFRQRVGQSMKEYHIHKRLSHAKALLAGGVRPIKRVAAAVGYDDECYFMRLFKKHTGVSPGRFR